MKTNKMNIIFIVLTIMVTITIAVSYFIFTDNSAIVPKSATLVKHYEVRYNG